MTIPEVLDAVYAAVPPAWVLAVMLAALNVLVFHVVVSGEDHSPFYLLPFGILGFAAGNLLASLVGSPLPMLGDVHVVEASVGAWSVLVVANGRKVAHL